MISVNMKQMDRWVVDQSNVKFFDHIMKNKGKVSTLDTRPYVEYLTEFNIFFTAH